jgi:hypothetical protein
LNEVKYLDGESEEKAEIQEDVLLLQDKGTEL